MLAILILCVPALIVRYLILKRPLGWGLSIAASFVNLILVLILNDGLIQAGLPHLSTNSIGAPVAIGFFILIAKRKSEPGQEKIEAIQPVQPQPEPINIGNAHRASSGKDGTDIEQSPLISEFVSMARKDAVETEAMTREKAERLTTPDRLQELDSLPQKESAPQGKLTRRSVLSILGAVVSFIGIVIAGAVGKECGRNLFRQFNSEGTFTGSTVSWARRKIPDIGVSIDLPGEPYRKDITLPPQAEGIVISHKSYECIEGGLTVGISHAVYADHITANPEGGARGSFENIRGLEGVADLQYSLTPQGEGRTAASGGFTRFGQAVDIGSLVIARNNKMWSVLVTHMRGNADAASAAKRILESMSVEPLEKAPVSPKRRR